MDINLLIQYRNVKSAYFLPGIAWIGGEMGEPGRIFSDPPTQAQVTEIPDEINELMGALKT